MEDKRRLRAVKGLSSRYVPYLAMNIPFRAFQFLPTGPESTISADVVRQFRKESRRDPEMRLAVLGILRAHSTNGAEAPLAAGSVLFASLGIVAAVTVTSSTGWLAVALGLGYAVVMVPTALWIMKISLAAHARRITAVTWLSAYEDEFRRVRGPWQR